MSHEALIEDLRQKSRERIRRIRIKAEARAEDLCKSKEEEFEKRQAEVLEQLKTEAERVVGPILHEAECQALNIEDAAMGRLSEMMYSLASELLWQVRQNDYESVFAMLVREIPQAEWKRVRVNPLDMNLARRFFPDCEIRTDPSIIGGYVAITEDGKFQVINTLQRRLEKGWPLMLPKILQEILEGEDAASAE